MSIVSNINIPSIDVSPLDIRLNHYDLNHDISKFMDYVTNREVKLSSSESRLLKADVMRMSKLMSCEIVSGDNFNSSKTYYPGFIERLVFQMGFINYNFSNTATIVTNKYLKYLDSSLQAQTTAIFDALNDKGSQSNNELVNTFPSGILDCFGKYAIGYIFEDADLKKVRNFLLGFFLKLETNKWYDVGSLIDYLKYNYPYFLFPKQKRKKENRRSSPYSYYKDDYDSDRNVDDRYYGFHDKWHNNAEKITTQSEKAFERVEGRYIERFLELIPFILGYVELAYNAEQQYEAKPSLGKLQGFRLTSRFDDFMNTNIREPKVTVQPNFEVIIESDIYPAKIMNTLCEIGTLLKKDIVSQIKIEKKKIIQKVAKDHKFNPIIYLESISDSPLPDNIKIEIKEWIGHAGSFILYNNATLLETKLSFSKTEDLVVEKINKKLSIIKNKNKFVQELEVNQLIPVTAINHNDAKFSYLTKENKSIFSKETIIAKRAKDNNLKKLKIEQQSLLRLSLENAQDFKMIIGKLLDTGCEIDICDTGDLGGKYKTVTISRKYKKQLDTVIEDLRLSYNVELAES